MSAGKIVQCIGAVVDVEFDRGAVPNIYDALTVADSEIMLEVQQQLGDGVVRTIALGTTDGLKRGVEVTNTGKGIMVPVGEKTLGRIMDVADERGEPDVPGSQTNTGDTEESDDDFLARMAAGG